MFDLLQLAHAKLAQEFSLADQDLRILVGHGCLIDVPRQSLSYVEGDFIDYRSQSLRARAVVLSQEYSLPIGVIAMDDIGTHDKNQQWLQMDNIVASARKLEKKAQWDGQTVIKNGEGSTDEMLIEDMQQERLLPPSVDSTDERSKDLKN